MTNSDLTVDTYRLGDLTVDFVRKEVRRGDATLAVKGLSFELLACLVRHYPDLATVKQINDEVWGDNVVTSATLSQRVKLLREALGSSEEYARYIEVFESRGYQLVVPVVPEENANESGPSKITAFLITLVLLLLLGTMVFIFIEGANRKPTAPPDTQTSALDLSEDRDLYHRAS